MNFEVVNPAWYPDQGGGIVVAMAFERPEPEYPGVATEQPQSLPAGQGGTTEYFIPMPQLARYPGTLYYLVILDSTLPVTSEARAYYERLLETLVVE